MIAVVLSLAAAACFAWGSILVAGVSRRLTSLQIVFWQMLFACLMTGAVSLALGGWRSIGTGHAVWLAGSSAAAIMVGGLTYIIAIKLMGPRLFALFFTLSSPFALVLGYVFRNETITLLQGAGVVLILAGIVLAILGAKDEDNPPRGRVLVVGTALGLVTALAQAVGNLFSRPAMLDGAEPFTATALRSGLGALFFLLLLILPPFRPADRLDVVNARRIGMSALAGMVLGMSLLMAALARGDVGIVSTLSSTTPILILPMVWAVSGRMPGVLAWVGAALAVAGTALISAPS